MPDKLPRDLRDIPATQNTISDKALVRKPNKYKGLGKKKTVKEYKDIQNAYN